MATFLISYNNATGTLEDVAYAHEFCVTNVLVEDGHEHDDIDAAYMTRTLPRPDGGTVEWGWHPAPTWPDYIVRCAGCNEIMHVPAAIFDAAKDRAEELGLEHGRDAASWLVGDMVTRETAERVLATVGDYLAEMPGPLSMEYATGYSTGQLATDVTYPEDDADGFSTICDAYENAYWDAVTDAVTREMQSVLGIDPETGEPYHADMIGNVYRVPRGIAAFIVTGGANGDMSVVGHYVGDDREMEYDADDLSPLGDDDFCHGCGATDHLDH